MIDKVSHLIHGIIPRSICLLRVEHEVQVSFSSLCIVIVRKYPARAGQQKSPIGRGVDHASDIIKRAIGATACPVGGFEFFDVIACMLRNRLQDLLPLFAFLKLIKLQKCFINIRRRGNQWSACLNRPGLGHPIERIPPGIFLETGRTRSLEHVEKMNASCQISRVGSGLVEKGEAHRIMRVGDWKAQAVVKEAAC